MKVQEEKIRLENDSHFGKISQEFKSLEEAMLQPLRTKLSETSKKLEDSEKKCGEIEKRKEEYKKWFMDLKRKDDKNKQALANAGGE